MVAFTLMNGSLVFVYEDYGDDADFSLLAGLGQHIRKTLRKGTLRFCISETCGLTEIPEAYQEAVRIQKISEKCGIEGTFITFEQLGVLSVLSLLPENKSIHRFKNKLLEPLKEYDAQHHTNLRETLETYLSTRCNAKLTSERMFAHYNTVIYRLERIREIGSFDLDDAEQILQLQIALKMDALHPLKPEPARKDRREQRLGSGH